MTISRRGFPGFDFHFISVSLILHVIFTVDGTVEKSIEVWMGFVKTVEQVSQVFWSFVTCITRRNVGSSSRLLVEHEDSILLDDK